MFAGLHLLLFPNIGGNSLRRRRQARHKGRQVVALLLRQVEAGRFMRRVERVDRLYLARDLQAQFVRACTYDELLECRRLSAPAELADPAAHRERHLPLHDIMQRLLTGRLSNHLVRNRVDQTGAEQGWSVALRTLEIKPHRRSRCA